MTLQSHNFKSYNILKISIFFLTFGTVFLIQGRGLIDEFVIGVISFLIITIKYKEILNYYKLDYLNKLFLILFIYLFVNSIYGIVVNNDIRIIRFSGLFLILISLIFVFNFYKSYLTNNINYINYLIVLCTIFTLSLLLIQSIFLELKHPIYLIRYSTQGNLVAGSSIFSLLILCSIYSAIKIYNFKPMLVFFYFVLIFFVSFFYDSRLGLAVSVIFLVINLDFKKLILIITIPLSIFLSFGFDIIKPIYHLNTLKSLDFNSNNSKKNIEYLNNFKKYYVWYETSNTNLKNVYSNKQANFELENIKKNINYSDIVVVSILGKYSNLRDYNSFGLEKIKSEAYGIYQEKEYTKNIKKKLTNKVKLKKTTKQKLIDQNIEILNYIKANKDTISKDEKIKLEKKNKELNNEINKLDDVINVLTSNLAEVGNDNNLNLFNNVNISTDYDVIFNPTLSDLDRRYAVIVSLNNLLKSNIFIKFFGNGFYSHRNLLYEDIKEIYNKKFDKPMASRHGEIYNSYFDYLDQTSDTSISFTKPVRTSLLPALVVDTGIFFFLIILVMLFKFLINEFKKINKENFRSKLNLYLFLGIVVNLTYINFFIDIIIIFIVIFLRDLIFTP